MDINQNSILYRLSFLLSFHYSDSERKAIMEDYREMLMESDSNMAFASADRVWQFFKTEQMEYPSKAGWIQVISRNVFFLEAAYIVVFLVTMKQMGQLGFFAALPVSFFLLLATYTLVSHVLHNYCDNDVGKTAGLRIAGLSFLYGLVFFGCFALNISGVYFGRSVKALSAVMTVGAVMCTFGGTYMLNRKAVWTGLILWQIILLSRLLLLNLNLMDRVDETCIRAFLLFLFSGVFGIAGCRLFFTGKTSGKR